MKKDEQRLNDIDTLKNVIDMMFSKRSFKIKKTEDIFVEAYNSIGKSEILSSKAVSVKGKTLVVNTKNGSEGNLLSLKKRALLKKIYEKTGNNSVTDIIFNILRTGDNKYE